MRGAPSAWGLSHLDPALSRCGSVCVDQASTTLQEEPAVQRHMGEPSEVLVHTARCAWLSSAVIKTTHLDPSWVNLYG